MKPVSQPDPLMDDKTSGERTSARRKSAGAKKASADESAHAVGKSVKDEGAKGEEVSIPVDTWKEIVRLAQIGEQAEHKPEREPEQRPEPQAPIAHPDMRAEAFMQAPPMLRPFLQTQPVPNTQGQMNDYMARAAMELKAHQVAATIAALRRKPIAQQ